MTTPDHDDLLAELGNVRVRFWTCLNKDHKTVVWDADVARCPDCGLTSQMTQRYQRNVRKHERGQVAAEVRGLIEKYETAAEHADLFRFIADSIEAGLIGQDRP